MTPMARVSILNNADPVPSFLFCSIKRFIGLDNKASSVLNAFIPGGNSNA